MAFVRFHRLFLLEKSYVFQPNPTQHNLLNHKHPIKNRQIGQSTNQPISEQTNHQPIKSLQKNNWTSDVEPLTIVNAVVYIVV